MFGDPIPAKLAEEWGLINLCVPADELISTATDWAQRLAKMSAPYSGPSMGEPGADLSFRVGHIKSQINMAMETSMLASFREEATLLGMNPGARAH